MRINRSYLAIGVIGFGVIGVSAFSPAADTSAAPLTTVVATSEAATAAASKAVAPMTAAVTAAPNTEELVEKAVSALSAVAARLSDDDALRMAFRAYYNYRDANPDKVKKPYFYFVDYGLDSREARGYVFNMKTLSVVEGPFTVAHGRGSSKTRDGIPTRFSNISGSATSSLGLFVGAELYAFTGKAGGTYYSTGLRMDGVSGRFNDAARERRVVAHGAPYVTASSSGRSEGCPAMEQARAKRLLPLIADGGMVFLFSPNDRDWLKNDPWAGQAI
jgi:hypothetical protein